MKDEYEKIIFDAGLNPDGVLMDIRSRDIDEKKYSDFIDALKGYSDLIKGEEYIKKSICSCLFGIEEAFANTIPGLTTPEDKAFYSDIYYKFWLLINEIFQDYDWDNP